MRLYRSKEDPNIVVSAGLITNVEHLETGVASLKFKDATTSIYENYEIYSTDRKFIEEIENKGLTVRDYEYGTFYFFVDFYWNKRILSVKEFDEQYDLIDEEEP